MALFSGVLQWGCFVLLLVALGMSCSLQYYLAWKRRSSAPEVVAKVPRFDQSVAFEVKLILFAALVFLYPVMLTALMLSKPSMRYWCGHWLLAVVIAIPAWLLLVHFGVAQGKVSRTMTPLVAITVPAAFLAFCCQLHVWWFGSQGVALLSDDCQSFHDKAALEASWQEADVLLSACIRKMSSETGSPLRQTALVLNFGECKGYTSAFSAYQRDWNYLRHMEQEYRCGGWCKPSAPLWYAQPLQQDSCSKVAGRVMTDGVALMMRQISAYSGLLMLGSCLVLFLKPDWLEDL